MMWFNTWCLTCWASRVPRLGPKQEHGAGAPLAPARDHSSAKSQATEQSSWGSSGTVAILQDKERFPVPGSSYVSYPQDNFTSKQNPPGHHQSPCPLLPSCTAFWAHQPSLTPTAFNLDIWGPWCDTGYSSHYKSTRGRKVSDTCLRSSPPKR